MTRFWGKRGHGIEYLRSFVEISSRDHGLPASGALLGYPDTGKGRTVRVRIKDCSRVPKGSHGNRRREGSEMGGRIDDDLREANLGEATDRYTTMRYFLGVSERV